MDQAQIDALGKEIRQRAGLPTTPEPRATLKLKLTSSTGYVYESTFTGITPEQWGRVCRILHGTDGVGAAQNGSPQGSNSTQEKL